MKNSNKFNNIDNDFNKRTSNKKDNKKSIISTEISSNAKKEVDLSLIDKIKLFIKDNNDNSKIINDKYPNVKLSFGGRPSKIGCFTLDNKLYKL